MRKFYLPFILLAIAAIVLSGCGGGGGGGGGGSDSGISVQIQGPQNPIGINASTTITATVNGATNTSVVWTVLEGQPAGGTLSNIQANSVVYKAPATTGTFHVKATSQADSSKSATATITVTSQGAISVVVNGPSGPLFPLDSVSITATVTGTTNTAVTWSILEGSPAGGILSNIQPTSVTYTAPDVSSGTFHIKATSQQDPTKSGTAAITVSDLPPPPPTGNATLK